MAKIVELQACRTGCAHDRSVVDHVYFNFALTRTQPQICVGSGADGVANDQKGYFLLDGWFQDQVFCLLLDQVAVCYRNALAVDLFQAFFVDAKDTGVGFEENDIAALDHFEAFHGDIVFIAKTESHHVQNHDEKYVLS